MKVEVKGVNFINKGAELMLRSILKEFDERNVNAKFCLNLKDIAIAPPDLDRLGFYPWRYSKKIPFLGKFINYIFEKLDIGKYKQRDVVTRNQIDVILDASGFVYSDQWGSDSAEVSANYYREAKEMGQKVILLPQAFGPFKDDKLKKAMQEIVKYADLIFARDKVSFTSIKELSPQADNVFQSKDFTIKMKSTSSNNATQHKACIIPNYRMIDMRGDNNYITFLDNIVSILNEMDQKFYFLIHESNKDKILIEQLEEKWNKNFEVITELNPLKIKEMIGASKYVISSRFHGIVSALTQNIPTIATGWSHKYQMLYAEYDINELFLDDLSNKELLTNIIKIINNEKEYSIIVKNLKQKNDLILNEVDSMWENVFNLINEN